MTISAPLPGSPAAPPGPRRIRLGGITALAQSAWMGFPLAADVLEQLESDEAQRADGGAARWVLDQG